MPTWWSTAFPGLGHLMVGSFLKGFILFIWELIINLKANINLGIFYSMQGKFDLAKDVIDKKWFLFYMAVYIIGIWDSYRTTVDLNKVYLLAKRENAPIVPLNMSCWGINYLDLRSPWVAMFWSVCFPGLGQLYAHRLVVGFFLIVTWIFTAYQANLLEAIHYTMAANFNQAKEILKPQWLLFLPSIYCWAFFDAYFLSVEYNKLFKMEQAQFLKKNYPFNSIKFRNNGYKGR
jgi:hypothetical protein